MNIIGISSEMFISSAAHISDGKIVSAAAEERFTREKRTRKFPEKVIDFILEYSNLKEKDIYAFAVAWNPSIYFSKFNPLFSAKRRHLVELMYSIPDYLSDYYKRGIPDYAYEEINFNNKKMRIYYITHHRAHLAASYYMSPFEKAAFLTVDSQGEFESTTMGKVEGNKLSLYRTIKYPQSIGMFYSTFTQFLGFRPNSDEWKVMALASFANFKNKYYKFLKENIVRIKENGEFEINLSYLKPFIHEQPNFYNNKFIEVFGKPRKQGEELNERHYEIASAMQMITEELLLNLLNYLYETSKIKKLILSGGVFMNSVFNGKILEQSKFDDVYISFAPDDSGTSIGAAYYLLNNILGQNKREYVKHSYFGPEYSNEEIELFLKNRGLNYRKLKDPEKIGAKIISEGKILGWFQGRMEFGQRALGNRSILADPIDPKIKDIVNKKIKYRESFRPFAASVLKEEQEEYFELGSNKESLFMERVFKVKKPHKVPAITHIDGTSRIQTVDKNENERYYGLIKEFFKIKGVPLILNTSYNLAGEPIVCSPEDAIKTFYSSGMDYLIIENFLLSKEF